MNRYLFPIFAAAAAALGASSAGAMTFELASTPFTDGGGSLSGSITLNSAETEITGYDLVTTAGNYSLFGTGLLPSQTSGATYKPGNSIAIGITLSSVSVFSPSSELTFLFGTLGTNSVTFSSANEVDSASALFERGTGTVTFVAEGSSPSPTSSVPESSTWIMMILGFGAIGGMMRRAYRKSEENFTRKVRSIATA